MQERESPQTQKKCVSSLLRHLIDGGWVDSQLPAMHQTSDNLSVREGYIFASVMRPVTEAMLAIAELDSSGSYVSLTQMGEDDDETFPILLTDNQWDVVTFANPEQSNVTGSNVWAGGGGLEMIAIVLGFDGQSKTEMGLVFPSRSNRKGIQDGFTTIRFCPSGITRHETRHTNITETTSRDMVLGELGFATHRFTNSFSGGDVDNHLQFPGSGKYLCEHLHTLPHYLQATAKELADYRRMSEG